MKRFLTLFPRTTNVELIKDVGMIPYLLYKNNGYDSTIACYNNGDYNYLTTEVSGLKLVFIKRIFNNEFLDAMLFLLTNSYNYDVLQMYHLNKLKTFTLYFFKLLRGRGSKTYLKLDTTEEIFSLRFEGFLGRIYKYLLKKIDIISIENKSGYQKINESNLLGRPVIYIPNGYIDPIEEPFERAFQKNKTILTVARIGTYQKNNEVLFEAFANLCTFDESWKLELIGPVDRNFEPYLKCYFEKNPQLKDRITLKGLITDRKIISSQYENAAIFVLTSRYEGFPLTFLEAIRAGCYIISSDFASAHDVIGAGQYGQIVPIGDVEALTQALLLAITKDHQSNIPAIKQNARANFYWPEIVNNLDQQLRTSN